MVSTIAQVGDKAMAAKKNVFVPAEGIKKLLKTIRKVFRKNAETKAKAKKSKQQKSVADYCMSFEEHQNWLNELLESAQE